MTNFDSVKYANYFDFFPGDKVFVLLGDKKVRSGTVLEYNFKVFKRRDDLVERPQYLIKVHHDDNTAFVKPEYVFSNLDDAVEALKTMFNDELEVVEVYDGEVQYINNGNDFDSSDPESYYN